MSDRTNDASPGFYGREKAARAAWEQYSASKEMSHDFRAGYHRAVIETARQLAAHDAEIRADAWDECLDAIEDNELNTEQARKGNPYRTPRPPAPELFPGVQERLDALSIRKGTP